MSTLADLARGWFRKAESNLAAARQVLAGAGPYDTACFHAQQAAKKYLKGALAFAGHPFPRTHNLEELERLCARLSPAPALAAVDLAGLTPYAVQMRYDFGFWPDRIEAEQALTEAEAVRHAILTIMPPETHP